VHNNFCLDIPEIIEEEKKQQEKIDDIAKFTKLAVSDWENSSQDRLVEELFSDKKVLKEYEEEVIAALSSNEQLLRDLGF
jgi:hypothetical protein